LGSTMYINAFVNLDTSAIETAEYLEHHSTDWIDGVASDPAPMPSGQI
jgi:hypothetical protein